MENTAAVEKALGAIEASVAALGVIVRGTGSGTGCPGADQLRQQADDCLDILAEAARLQAKTAALTAGASAGFADATMSMESPAATPQEHTAQEMAVVAEVARVLTVSERAAGALLAESRELSTALPLTLAALGAGSISWQHARVMVDETANLGPAGAAALEAHFLDPDAPN
ncbi:MAG TPA: DUF222 domain-containing protein, partial [Arthrobacter sp.]